MRAYPAPRYGATMERATASVSRPSHLPSLTEWELTFDPSFHECESDEIPDAAHPQEFHLYEETRSALLTSENLALHDLFHGKVAWIIRSDYGHSSDEVMVQGQPVKRRTSYDACCHCGKCNWTWFLQGWVCWPEQQ